MSEVVNALVAFAVIVFIFRWATSGHSSPPPPPCPPSPVSPGPSSSDSRSAAAALGFRPKHVTQDMVPLPPVPARPTAHHPHPGRPNQYHVPRHTDVRTPAPAHTRRLMARSPPETTSASTSCAQAASSSPRTRFSSAGSSSRYVPPPLFFARGLNAALDQPPQAYFTLYPRSDDLNNAQRRPPQTTASATTSARHPSLIERYQLAQKIADEPSIPDEPPADVGGKAKWEDTPDKREASLRERKAQMVLAARQ